MSSAQRLVASPGMGTAYKVFALAHADLGEQGVPGFASAPRLSEITPAPKPGTGGTP